MRPAAPVTNTRRFAFESFGVAMPEAVAVKDDPMRRRFLSFDLKCYPLEPNRAQPHRVRPNHAQPRRPRISNAWSSGVGKVIRAGPGPGAVSAPRIAHTRGASAPGPIVSASFP